MINKQKIVYVWKIEVFAAVVFAVLSIFRQPTKAIYLPHDKLMIITHDHAWPIEPPTVLL